MWWSMCIRSKGERLISVVVFFGWLLCRTVSLVKSTSCNQSDVPIHHQDFPNLHMYVWFKRSRKGIINEIWEQNIFVKLRGWQSKAKGGRLTWRTYPVPNPACPRRDFRVYRQSWVRDLSEAKMFKNGLMMAQSELQQGGKGCQTDTQNWESTVCQTNK